MKTKRHLLKICLLGVALLPAVVHAQFTFTTNNGAITITGYTGSGGGVVIPSATNGYPVTSIGNSAFYNKSSVANVTIPNSVTNIGDWAFVSCIGLTNVTIGTNVIGIGEGAFSACDSLATITVDTNSSSYSSGDGVLFNKSQTTLIQCPGGKAGNYTIPNSVTNIGNYAFYDCTSLTSVTIPNSVTNIGNYAFGSCMGLTNVTMGSNVISIAFGAFYYCTNLTSVTIPNSVTIISDYAFYLCTSLASVTIPNSVTSIGDEAFGSCMGLTNVTMGSNVISIGNGALDYCTSLTSITVDALNSSYSSVAGVLFNKSQTTLIQCPGGKAGNYTIPNSVTNIGNSAFYLCTSLASVTIPNSVTSIGDEAFGSCMGLTNVTIGTNVISIGNGALDYCTSLTSITVDALNSSYSSVAGVLFNKSQTTLIQCPGGKAGNYTIPNSVTNIGNYAFYDCTSLTSVTIPNSVTNIGNWAFESCMGLTNVTIGSNVISIAFGAFYYCTNLTSVTIPNSVTIISDYAFYLCTSLASVTIPNSVTNIGNWAFESCMGLTNVTIGSNVISIGSYAFYYCTNLTRVFFQGNAPSSIGGSVFFGDNHATIYYLWGTIGWGTDLGGLPCVLLFPLSKTFVVAWGNNGDGQTTVPAGLTNAVAIAAGDYHSLALRADGTVVAWGYNGSGQTTVPAGLTNAVAIAAGGSHSLALRADGTVVAWGSQTTVPAGLTNAVAIAAGYYHSLALRADGTVVAWGYNGSGQTTVPAGLANAVATAAGGYYSLALRADGTVVAWGDNYYGQTNVPAGLTNAVAIAAGYYHSLALRADGTVVAWGKNGSGQTTVPAGLTSAVAIAAGDYHTLALIGNSRPFLNSRLIGQLVFSGSTVFFRADAFGTLPLTYQWQCNGTNLLGATNSVLTLPMVQQSQSGNYQFIVTNVSGSVTSSVALLTVINEAPSINSQPNNQTNMTGAIANFTITASGSVPVSYQWRKDGINLVNNGRISGVSSIGLTITNLQSSDAGNYTVVVTNAFGSVTSSVATLLITIGVLDTSFDLSGIVNNAVKSLIVQPDHKLLVVNGNMIRLNSDGSTDGSFSQTTGGACMALQNDGKILFGGWFTSVNGVGRNYIARLNGDGTLDTSFLSGLSSSGGGLAAPVQSVALLPNGQVLIGGTFTSISGIARGNLARLNSNGTLDTNFLSGLSGTGNSGPVCAIVVQPDGKILVGGYFTNFNSTPRNLLARLNSDGTLDASFQDGLAGYWSEYLNVSSLALKPDGKIVVGGYFYVGANSSVAQLNPNGTLDTSFYTDLDASVSAVAVRSDGKIYIGGQFTIVNGMARNHIARLNANGTIDTGFLNGLSGATGSGYPFVYAIALDTGKVYIGGNFTYVNGLSRPYLARLFDDLPVSAPTISAQPPSREVPIGATVSFGVTSTGNETLYYQWRKNGTNLVDAGNLSGVTTTNLTISSVQTNDAGNYTVVVTNAYGSVTSSVAVLSISPMELVVTLADYYPLPLGADWLYDGTDWDGNPAKTRYQVVSVNRNITLYTGHSPAASYTTNCVDVFAGYLDRTTLAAYDTWDEYMANGGRFGQFGDDDLPDESLRVDGGAIYPAQMAVGSSATSIADAYLSGTFAGVMTNVLQVVERTSLTVPAGYFPDVLHVRMSIAMPGNSQVHDEWWARSVGKIKRAGISGGGAALNYELIQYSVPLPPAPPIIHFDDGSKGIVSNKFGFNITGSSNLVIVVEASTNLTNWLPVSTNTLNTFIGTNGSSYFSDSQWTNYHGRFYRLRSP